MSELLACTGCGHRISARAKACPSCGEPNEARPMGALVWTFTILAALLAAFMAFAFYTSSLPGANEAGDARDEYNICMKLARAGDGNTRPCDLILGNFRDKYGRYP
jgi:hypothetical protein